MELDHTAGLVDPSELLANIEAQICKVKDEALSRKEIMEKIDRWLSACDEEKWLEDYNLVSYHIMFRMCKTDIRVLSLPIYHFFFIDLPGSQSLQCWKRCTYKP